jgi:hypothetical protein
MTLGRFGVSTDGAYLYCPYGACRTRSDQQIYLFVTTEQSSGGAIDSIATLAKRPQNARSRFTRASALFGIVKALILMSL